MSMIRCVGGEPFVTRRSYNPRRPGCQGVPMQHVLRISRKIDYAIRAMIHLASIPEGTVVPFREIGKQMSVPEDFLAKILKTLVDQGIVGSTRGPHGGYRLARPAETINVLEVIEAAEGPVAVNVCLDDDACSRQHVCSMT